MKKIINKILNLILIASTLGFSANAQKPAGLVNCGASCYMNASVQCLANIPELRNWLIANRDSFAQNSILTNFTNLIEQIKNRTEEVLNTQALFNSQGARFFPPTKTSRNNPSRMQDADEFLMQFLNVIPQAQEAQNIFSTNIIISEQFKAFATAQYLAEIDNLPKILKLQNNISFEAGIENFFYNEGILKKISKLPNTLILRLGRDKETPSGFQKDNKSISFPVNNLDLQNYLTDPTLGPAQYNLIGIVCHIGNNLQCGHYYSYVKDSQDNNWYQCNDNNVDPVNLAEIEKIAQNGIVRQNDTPYILFYQRKEDVLRPEAADEAGPPREQMPVPMPLAPPAQATAPAASEMTEDEQLEIATALSLSDTTTEEDELKLELARALALSLEEQHLAEKQPAKQPRGWFSWLGFDTKDQDFRDEGKEQEKARIKREEEQRLAKEQSLAKEQAKQLLLRQRQEQQRQEEQRILDKQKLLQKQAEQQQARIEQEKADRHLAKQIQREEQEHLAKNVPAQPQTRRQPVAPAQPVVEVAPPKEVTQKINDSDIKNKMASLNRLFDPNRKPKPQRIRTFESIKKLLVKYNICLEQKELDQSVMDYLNLIIQK